MKKLVSITTLIVSAGTSDGIVQTKKRINHTERKQKQDLLHMICQYYDMSEMSEIYIVLLYSFLQQTTDYPPTIHN